MHRNGIITVRYIALSSTYSGATTIAIDDSVAQCVQSSKTVLRRSTMHWCVSFIICTSICSRWWKHAMPEYYDSKGWSMKEGLARMTEEDVHAQ